MPDNLLGPNKIYRIEYARTFSIRDIEKQYG